MPANVSVPAIPGFPLLAGTSGAPARKGEQTPSDAGFAALLAMLVGQGIQLPIPLTPPPGEYDAEPVAAEGLTELLQRVTVAGIPAAVKESLVAALEAQVEGNTVAQATPPPVQGASTYVNTEHGEEPAPLEPLMPEHIDSPLDPIEVTVLHLPAEVSQPVEPLRPTDQNPGLPEPLRQLSAAPVPADRLLQRISQAVTQTRSGEYTVTLKLHPQELGEVRLLLHLSGREVRTVLEVAHPQVQHMLESQGDTLRQNLVQAGLALSSFEVNTGQGGQTARDRKEQLEDLLRSQRRGRGSAAPAVQPPSAPRLRATGLVGPGSRLDTTA